MIMWMLRNWMLESLVSISKCSLYRSICYFKYWVISFAIAAASSIISLTSIDSLLNLLRSSHCKIVSDSIPSSASWTQMHFTSAVANQSHFESIAEKFFSFWMMEVNRSSSISGLMDLIDLINSYIIIILYFIVQVQINAKEFCFRKNLLDSIFKLKIKTEEWRCWNLMRLQHRLKA